MRRPARWLLTALLVGGSIGCGHQQFGALMYHMGLFPAKSIPAQFELTAGPLLILIDDDYELLTSPTVSDALVDRIATNLREAKVNRNVISKERLNTMRQAEVKYAQRSIGELGRRFDAEQVLWLQITDFRATKEFEDVGVAARFTLRVKVFDPNATAKAKMRLWPNSREGEFVTIEMSASQIQPLKTDADIARRLTTEAARKVAELFYKHPPEE